MTLTRAETEQANAGFRQVFQDREDYTPVVDELMLKLANFSIDDAGFMGMA